VPIAEPGTSASAARGALARAIPSEVVEACRVLHAAGLGNGVWGLVAARDPSARGVWMTRGGVGFDEVGLEDLVLVSSPEDALDVARLDGEGALALEVMASRADVSAVVHAHSLYATAFAATGRALQAISHEGCHLVPPDVARARAPDEPGDARAGLRRLAGALGARNAMLLAGHGLITVAGALGEAVALAVYLEKACRLQLLAGARVHTAPDAEVIEKREGQLRRPRISWEYLRRVTPPASSAPA
jgi:ribulose-5-phosphate 4-epimerase/fuculose-1-phosphate aldolase